MNDDTFHKHTGSAHLHVILLTRLHIMTTHLTSDIHPPNDNISFSHLLCSHTWNPHSTWHLLHSDLPRTHSDMHAYIKAWFAHVNHDFANFQGTFSVSLTSREINCSGGSNISRTFSVQHGSMQLSGPEHQLDGGDAAHWWTIPSDDRISLDLQPHRQSSFESGDVGAHRLCPTHQSAQDHFRAR